MGELRPGDTVLLKSTPMLGSRAASLQAHAVLLLGPCLAVAVPFGVVTIEGAMKSLGVSEIDKPQEKKPSPLTL